MSCEENNESADTGDTRSDNVDDKQMLSRIDIDITVNNGKHTMRKVAETNVLDEDDLTKADENIANGRLELSKTVAEPGQHETEDFPKLKSPYYLSDESDTFTEHEYRSKISTSSSVYADSGISISSQTKEEQTEEMIENSHCEIQTPKTRFSLDESQRKGDVSRIFKSSSRTRRSCSLPDILDFENYKIGDQDEMEVKGGTFDSVNGGNSGFVGIKSASNIQLSRPLCGQFHSEDPCYICFKDNEIYCSVCVQLHNFHCKEKVKYIPEIAPELKTGLYNDTVKELQCMRERLSKVKSENTEHYEKLNAMRKTYTKSVMKFKNSIIEIIDRIEKEALQEMDVVFHEEKEKIENNLKHLENEISNIDRCLGRFQNNANTVGNGVIFDIQEAIQEAKTYECKLREIHLSTHALVMAFKPCEEFEILLTHVDKFWTFKKSETMMCKIPYSCTCDKPYIYRAPVKERDFSARLSGWSFDREKCYITGCKFMSNGCLLLCDNNNKKIKMFDKKYKCTSVVSLHSMPWDVEVIDPELAVVSLPDKKQLQLVGTHHNKLSQRHSLILAKNCWGISYRKNNLYVTCWSRGGSEVVIIDLFGNAQRVIDTIQGNPFHTPWYVVSHNDVIYISDWGTYTVPCVTVTGTAVKTYRSRNLVGPLGMTIDPEGNVYVCGRDSNNIHQMLPDGSAQLILTEKDGIHQPLNVSHCSSDDRLIVTSWMSDKIQVFKLN